MKLSRRARYALKMMLEIARSGGEGRKVSLTTVSANTNMPRRSLEQLAMSLRNASLVVGITGKGGGYELARPADQIRLGQIVEAAIGQINVVECVKQPELCMQVEYCDCRWIYERINEGITDVLNEFSLADLAARKPARDPEQTVDGSGCPTRTN